MNGILEKREIDYFRRDERITPVCLAYSYNMLALCGYFEFVLNLKYFRLLMS